MPGLLFSEEKGEELARGCRQVGGRFFAELLT